MRQRFALVFLVLLRMAIGWHFLFEAVEKHRTINIGETPYNKPWTSESYFREGTGPMAKLVKSQIGDIDDLLLARMTPRALPAGTDPNTVPPRERMPELLDREWSAYLDRFIAHYNLDAAAQEKVREVLQQEKDYTVQWLTLEPNSIGWLLSGMWRDHDRTPFKRTYPGGEYEVDISIAERVEEYRERVKDLRELGGDKYFVMGKDVEKTRRPATRSEVTALRSELQGLLDERTEGMRKALAQVVDKNQVTEKGPVPPAPRHWVIRSIDFMTMWGLLLIGGALLLGVFSRTAALAGALFLILTLLTHPPLPWLPVPPNSEGNYVFVSKNVIELLALLMLACIPSGRWFGIDALLHPIFQAISPFSKKDDAQ